MSKKGMEKVKQTKFLIVVLILILIAIGCCVFAILKKENKSSIGTETDNSKIEESDSQVLEFSGEDELENIEIEVKSSEDYVDPAEGTLDMEKIQGFTVKYSGTAGESTSVEKSETGEADEGMEKSTIMLADENLTVEAIGSYSGNFLEDGSDEPIVNVAAMLITNNSDSMLQIAQITFQVNDLETAEFKVTNLPAGTSVLVLESNKREYREEDSYTYGETASGYMEQPTLEEDKFELITEMGKITLKNKTDQAYEQVYVYYKYVQIGGAYLGGITYRTPFENVPAGGEVEAVAGHFNPGSSQIMAVQIVQ